MRALLAVAALLVAACVPSEGPSMAAGEDCLSCHDGRRARKWTVAGTVFAAADAGVEDGVGGALVHVRDSTGWAASLRTNEAGNFYLADDVVFPLFVSLEKDGRIVEMGIAVKYGGCNSCHLFPGYGQLHPAAAEGPRPDPRGGAKNQRRYNQVTAEY